ncbi:restriction endonuclease subunit S [Vibrio parahaemolyticus]|nr:restriction endonuclease subunit S [Vibrio parahaemolyticus]
MVPNGWESSMLGDVCQIINGRPFKPHEWRESGLPIIRIQNLNGSNEYNYYDGEFSDKVLIKSGQLLFAWSGSKGSSFGPHIWNGPDGLLNYHTWRINVKDNVDSEFFFQYLRVITTRIESKAHGASALVHTQKGEMEKFPIVIPPLSEQRKIAQILSAWDRGIATTEKLIDASKQQKKALMQQLLTGKKRLVDPETGKAFEGEWEEVKLGDVCTPQQWATISSKALLDEGYPVYGANGHIGFYSEFNHEYETVAVTCRGSTCGEVSLIPEKSYITGNAMCLDNISPAKHSYIFVYYALCKRGFTDVISGSAQPQIVGKAIKNVKFIIPALKEQQKIASVLTSADKDIQLLEVKLLHFKQEKKALMQQLLTGKRRVKVPETEAA